MVPFAQATWDSQWELAEWLNTRVSTRSSKNGMIIIQVVLFLKLIHSGFTWFLIQCFACKWRYKKGYYLRSGAEFLSCGGPCNVTHLEPWKGWSQVGKSRNTSLEQWICRFFSFRWWQLYWKMVIFSPFGFDSKISDPDRLQDLKDVLIWALNGCFQK